MSLDYSPEVLRQREHYKQVRARLDGPKEKPVRTFSQKPLAVAVTPPVTAESLWSDWLCQRHRVPVVIPQTGKNPSVKEICAEVCRQFKVKKMDLESARRWLEIAQARHAAFALSKHLTSLSYPAIGRMLNRDHTTIMHACHKYQPIMDMVAMKVPEGSPLDVWVAAFRAEIVITRTAPSKYRRFIERTDVG